MSVIGDLKTIAKDLTQLEVNTIIKPNISGGKMPKTRHALISIAKNFFATLADHGCGLDQEVVMGDYETYGRIRDRAKQEINRLTQSSLEHPLSDRQTDSMYLLMRIKDMCDLVREVMQGVRARVEKEGKQDSDAEAWQKNWQNQFTRNELNETYQPYELSAEDLTKVRKIWEIGTEEIVMQTVVQLDGDVINRIRPGYAKAEHLSLHQLHNQGVETSIRYWNNLINVAVNIVDNLVSKFK